MRRLALISLLVGCGPSVRLIGDGEAGGSAEGGSSGDADTDGADRGDAVDTIDPADSGDDDGGAVPACDREPTPGVDPFAGDPGCPVYYGTTDTMLPVVTVRFINETNSELRIPAHTTPPLERYFDVTGTMGGREFITAYDQCRAYWEPPGCHIWGPGGDPGCELIDYPPLPDLDVGPGATVEREWDAWLVTTLRLPAVCNDVDNVSVECQSPIAAGPGSFEVVARGTVDDVPIPGRGRWDGQCGVIEIHFHFE